MRFEHDLWHWVFHTHTHTKVQLATWRLQQRRTAHLWWICNQFQSILMTMWFLWINEVEKSKRSNMKNNFHVTLAERQMTIAETNAEKKCRRGNLVVCTCKITYFGFRLINNWVLCLRNDLVTVLLRLDSTILRPLQKTKLLKSDKMTSYRAWPWCNLCVQN
jgi:hypothetical protein